MGLSSWLSRCFPGLSLITLIIFLEATFGIARHGLVKVMHPHTELPSFSNNFGLYLFAAYSLMLHLMSWSFTVRLCYAARRATVAIEKYYRRDMTLPSPKLASADNDGSASADLWSNFAPTASSKITMAIIIPAYKEDILTMEDTLSVLASHAHASTNYDIYLAMEQRDPEGTRLAQQLIGMFKSRFRRITHTSHPDGLAGEAPGKSSNVSWAAKEVERVYSGTQEWNNVLVTVMDSDTHLMSQYFKYIMLSHERNGVSGHMTGMTLYMPPIVFDRNANNVPRLVRVADLMWCGAGLSCFLDQPSQSGVAIPTSVYTVPLALVHLVDGWDTGPDAIGEDMHMMLKCYYGTNGRVTIHTVPSPASQCNISVDTIGLRGWVDQHRARYKQGLRHMWGALDTGYAIRKWANMGRNMMQDIDDASPSTRQDDRLLSKSHVKLNSAELSPRHTHRAAHGRPRGVSWRNFVVFTRLFEAHFLPIHLVVVMLASSICGYLVGDSPELSWFSAILDLTAYLRSASYVTMLVYFACFYERFHYTCIRIREEEMTKAGLQEQLEGDFSYRRPRNPASWLDYFVFPVAGTIFGSACLFQAAISHFFTNRIVYSVSSKPIRLPIPGSV